MTQQIDVERLWTMAVESSTSETPARYHFAALVLVEAAKVCDRRYESRVAGGFPREASTARVLAEDIRALAVGVRT